MFPLMMMMPRIYHKKTRWWRRTRWKVESPADCVARRVAFFPVPSSWGSPSALSSATITWPATARARSRCQRLALARRRKAHALKVAQPHAPMRERNAAASPAMTGRAGQSTPPSIPGQSSRRSQLRASMHRLQSKVRPRVDAAGRLLPPSHRRMARPRHGAQQRARAGGRQI